MYDKYSKVDFMRGYVHRLHAHFTHVERLLYMFYKS